MKYSWPLILCIALIGCSGDNTKVSDLDDCVHEAILRENYMIRRRMRWIRSDNAYHDDISFNALIDAVHFFSTNTALYRKCAVPLFVRFEKGNISKRNVGSGRLLDIRGNSDYPFRMEMSLLGEVDSLLDNRLYFIFPQTNTTVVWSRLVNAICADMYSIPRLEQQCTNGMGVYAIRRSFLAPVFLGDDAYSLEDFLKCAATREVQLYWHCGKWGLSEGKHVYEKQQLVSWLDYWKDALIPMKVIFSAYGTYIFSVAPCSVGEVSSTCKRMNGSFVEEKR